MSTLSEALEMVQPLLTGEHVRAVSLFAIRSKELEDELASVVRAESELTASPSTIAEAIAHALVGAACAYRTSELFTLRRAHDAHVRRFAAGVLVAALMRVRPTVTTSNVTQKGESQ
jgi:hypothetical protein